MKLTSIARRPGDHGPVLDYVRLAARRDVGRRHRFPLLLFSSPHSLGPQRILTGILATSRSFCCSKNRELNPIVLAVPFSSPNHKNNPSCPHSNDREDSSAAPREEPNASIVHDWRRLQLTCEKPLPLNGGLWSAGLDTIMAAATLQRFSVICHRLWSPIH